MPEGKVVYYREGDWVPVIEWLVELKEENRKAFANGYARIKLLEQEGYALDRPASGFLGQGIHELRWKQGHIQLRILYFFHDRNVAVLAHPTRKTEAEVDKADIKRAIERKTKFEANPQAHTFEKEIENV